MKSELLSRITAAACLAALTTGLAAQEPREEARIVRVQGKASAADLERQLVEIVELLDDGVSDAQRAEARGRLKALVERIRKQHVAVMRPAEAVEVEVAEVDGEPGMALKVLEVDGEPGTTGEVRRFRIAEGEHPLAIARTLRKRLGMAGVDTAPAAPAAPEAPEAPEAPAAPHALAPSADGSTAVRMLLGPEGTAMEVVELDDDHLLAPAKRRAVSRALIEAREAQREAGELRAHTLRFRAAKQAAEEHAKRAHEQAAKAHSDHVRTFVIQGERPRMERSIELELDAKAPAAPGAAADTEDLHEMLQQMRAEMREIRAMMRKLRAQSSVGRGEAMGR